MYLRHAFHKPFHQHHKNRELSVKKNRTGLFESMFIYLHFTVYPKTLARDYNMTSSTSVSNIAITYPYYRRRD